MSDIAGIVINTDVLPGADGMYRHDVLSEIRLPNLAELFIHPDPRVAELEYRLHKQAEVHAYEKEALQHQVKMLSDPIVRKKMLEPAPPIYIEANKFVDPRVAELEAVLRECRGVLSFINRLDDDRDFLDQPEYEQIHKAIAKIDEVLHRDP